MFNGIFMKMVHGWRAGLVDLGERMPEVGVSAGDLISSAAGLSTVDLLVSGVATTAEAEDSGRVGALGTSGVSLPDLLSLLESRLLSFLRGCFSFSFSGGGVEEVFRPVGVVPGWAAWSRVGCR